MLPGKREGMSEDNGVGPVAASVHGIRQPLNVIRLATGNVRTRILPLLQGDDARYLEEKLVRIERQVDRAAEIVAVMAGD